MKEKKKDPKKPWWEYRKEKKNANGAGRGPSSQSGRGNATHSGRGNATHSGQGNTLHGGRENASHSGRGNASYGGRGNASHGGRGNASHGGRGRGTFAPTTIKQAAGRDRAVFTKLVKDESARIANSIQAKAFVSAMSSFESKAELLSQLTDNRYFGLDRIQDALSFINSVQDMDALLIQMLANVVTEETARPLYRTVRTRVLLKIFMVPGLLDAAVEHKAAQLLSKESAAILCSFLLAVAMASMEARESQAVSALAQALRDRGDVGESKTLCAVILLAGEEGSVNNDRKPAAAYANPLPKKKSPAAACWVTDMIPPGGRHDNDKQNYRSISIVPTVDELKCQEKPYLPLSSGDNAFIEDPESRLLDRNFRLLRHDAIHTITETVSEQERPWLNARVVGLDVDKNTMMSKGVSFIVQCDNRYTNEGRDWASRFRTLMQGSLVALCDEKTGHLVRLGTITVREDHGKWLNAPCGPRIGVVFQSPEDFETSMKEITLNCGLNHDLYDLRKREKDGGITKDTYLLHAAKLKERMVTYTLIEASKSFFAYEPILRTLKEMDTVPLADELVHCRRLGPPDYLPDVLALPKGKNFNAYKCRFDKTWSKEDVKNKTSLDVSQADALHHTFTSRVALIQGPPGTGKTFMGALIARMILQNTSETILCVCVTNHALDQFLEHLLHSGEKRIVRLGGRSKSSDLEGYQLSNLSRCKGKPDSTSSKRIKQVDAAIHGHREELEKRLVHFQSPANWTKPSGGIKALLLENYPQILDLLSVPSLDDGFSLVGPGGKVVNDGYLWDTWREGAPFPDWLRPHFETLLDAYNSDDFDNFWSLPLQDRLELGDKWRREVIGSNTFGVLESVQSINELLKERKELKQAKDLQVLRDARVIGATTAGAASFRDVLSEIGAGVVIVEEAGEVLEAHVLTSLSAKTKHIILIGDHKQLRPKVETYHLSASSKYGYDLDCSLFERLVNDGLPAVTLQVQHRMRPSISRLIRAQTYPSLKDHKSVFKYPDVNGVCKNVVFLHHTHRECGEDDGTSKKNVFEAGLCIELVRYFLLQGYKPDQVVVLTPYLGQLRLLMDNVKKNLNEVTALLSERDLEQVEDQEEDNDEARTPADASSATIRCSSVDNFQGEEADIIIVSLVRSNDQGSIGFLKEEQRVNVLLSRARMGMFLVGNSECLRQTKAGYAVWNPIFNMLAAAGEFRYGLPTKCQLHPDDEPIELKTQDDFRLFRPNGGCDRPCDFRLKMCGHSCPQMCHPIDQDHTIAQRRCVQPCRRFPPECNQKHVCRNLCKDECGPCRFPVGPVRLLCSHTSASAVCHDIRSGEAMKLFSASCREKVEHVFAGCNHRVLTTCSNARSTSPRCPAKCGKILACGHPCQNECSRCDNDHHDCRQTCEKALFCGHLCGAPCHLPDPCKPCDASCRVKCSHSRCPEKCCLPCAPCVEKCDWSCKHQGRCPLVCGAPCARLPCNKRCEAKFKCGHRCPSLCGEKCPSQKYCQECAPKKLKERVVDLCLMSTYKDHNVDDDPIIFLSCEHFYAASTLDGHLNLKEVYQLDPATNEFIELKSLRTATVSEKPMVCPDCRVPIGGIKRYGRMLNLSMIRGLERKHMMQLDEMLDRLSKRSLSNVAPLLERALTRIRKGPMQKIFEACSGSHLIEVPSPPAGPHIRALELKALAFATKSSNESDDDYKVANESFLMAIDVAMEHTSLRSAALLKISLVKFWLKFVNDIKRVKSSADPHLEWVIGQSQFTDLVQEAQSLRGRLNRNISAQEMKEIFKAMSQITGYDYGGSPSSHWFQCPNGHPYFIGECGGAMEVSRCNECGAEIGGSSHQLLPTNQQATGLWNRIFGRPT